MGSTSTYSSGAVAPSLDTHRKAQQGDQDALERIWEFYEPYVNTVARSFYRSEYGGEFLEDLFAEARFRFCKAIQFYRPDNEGGVPFNRYARTIIARALLDMRLAKQKDVDNLAKTELLDLEELREVAFVPDELQNPCDTRLVQVLNSLDDKDREYALLLCTGKGWLASANELKMTRTDAKAAIERIKSLPLWADQQATDGHD